MALLLKAMYKFYKWSAIELADPRTEDFLFVNSPIYPLIIIILYVCFVLKFGPKCMSNRNPFNLERIMIVYNLMQVIYCVFVVYEGSRLVLFKYDIRCAPIDYSDSEEARYITRLVWSYFIIKIIDLLDTIFIVLRKKSNQISFLHVYHHAGMVALAWGGTRYLPGGHSVYIGIFNCFVHAIMYLYYLLTAYDKKYKKSIWWKKHITQLQLIQFTLFTVIYGQLFFRPSCQYPRATMLVFVPQNLFMTILFADFYYKTYIKKQTNESNNVEQVDKKKINKIN